MADDTSRKTFSDLVELSKVLRGPGGCPWDKEQTLESVKGYIIEEAYEVIQAIEDGDIPELREELGDLLYQVVFAASITSEQGHFTAEDVVHDLHGKLVRRHPHVFGDETAADTAKALRIWQGQKKAEKSRTRSIVEIPRGMPALVRAQRVGDKASHVGFDWKRTEEVMAKVHEELGELEEAIAAGDPGAREAEWGDLVFALVNLARFLGLDAEGTAHAAVQRFIERFITVEEKAAARGNALTELTLAEMDELWEEAKEKG